MASSTKPLLSSKPPASTSEQLSKVGDIMKGDARSKAHDAVRRRASFAARNVGASTLGGDEGKGIPNSMNITSVVEYANRIRKVRLGGVNDAPSEAAQPLYLGGG